MKAIYKFHFHCGRSGTLHGLFVEDSERVEALVESGRAIHFGEALGKHSDISGPLDREDYSIVSNKPEDVEVVERLGLETGWNPIQTYIEREEDQGNEHIFDGKAQE